MDIIYGGRGQGKTVTLVKYSAEKKIPIVVFNEPSRRRILEIAHNLGVRIPEPISIEKIRSRRAKASHVDKCVLDDIERILSDSLDGISVQAFTIDTETLNTVKAKTGEKKKPSFPKLKTIYKNWVSKQYHKLYGDVPIFPNITVCRRDVVTLRGQHIIPNPLCCPPDFFDENGVPTETFVNYAVDEFLRGHLKNIADCVEVEHDWSDYGEPSLRFSLHIARNK